MKAWLMLAATLAACSDDSFTSDDDGPDSTPPPSNGGPPADEDTAPPLDSSSPAVTMSHDTGPAEESGTAATISLDNVGHDDASPPIVTVPPEETPPVEEVPVEDPTIPPDHVIVGGPPSTCQVWETTRQTIGAGRHFPEGWNLTYLDNPPAGGPDWEMWASYGKYDQPVDRERWMHNLRHGAIVLTYRPDAPQEVIDALTEAYWQLPGPMGKYNASPQCGSMGIMTPDPELDDTYAVLAFGWVMQSNCVPQVDDILDFAERHVYEGQEKECFNGDWPMRGPCNRFESVRFSQWTRDVGDGTPVSYDDNPPSSGPYWPSMIPYQRFGKIVAPEHWVGLLARGGVVILYRPDIPPAMRASLEQAYDALPNSGACPSTVTAMVQDPNLPTAYAMVAFNQYMSGECFDGWEMPMFVGTRRGWGPIRTCEEGTWVP